MDYTFIKPGKDRLCEINSLMEEARESLSCLGITQWQNGYPQPAVILNDIENGCLHAAEADGKIKAVFALLDFEPDYEHIYGGAWLLGDNAKYTALHRVAVSKSSRGTGLSGMVIDYAKRYAADRAAELLQNNSAQGGAVSLRCDTHIGNIPMQKLLERNGFVLCGSVRLESGYIADYDRERLAYEYVSG